MCHGQKIGHIPYIDSKSSIMTEQNSKLPTSFWVIGIVALIWNLMGVLAFVGQLLMDEEALSALPEDQRALVEATPSWLVVIFGIATIGGLLGCILLLMRKSLAVNVFLVSLVAVVIQMGYSWFMTDTAAVYGTVQGVVMPLLVIIIGAYLYYYSKQNVEQGILT